MQRRVGGIQVSLKLAPVPQDCEHLLGGIVELHNALIELLFSGVAGCANWIRRRLCVCAPGAGAARGGGRAMARTVLRSPGRARNCSPGARRAPRFAASVTSQRPFRAAPKLTSLSLSVEKGGAEGIPLQAPRTGQRWWSAFRSNLVPVNLPIIILDLVAGRTSEGAGGTRSSCTYLCTTGKKITPIILI